MSKGTKKNVSIEEVIENKKQQVESLRQQCYAVEKMLGISSTQRLRVEAERDDTLRQIAVTQNEMEDLEKTLENHVKFMRNLSSTTAEQLKQRYDTVQKSVETAEEENNALRQKIADLIERKEEELRQSEEEVAAQQHHIDEKALLFGIQLKERLNKARS